MGLMKNISWSLLKNEELKKIRGMSFEELLNNAKLIAIKEHPVRKKQSIILFEYKKYIWIVPYVENTKGIIFLKTAYPSRKYTKMYYGGQL